MGGAGSALRLTSAIVRSLGACLDYSAEADFWASRLIADLQATDNDLSQRNTSEPRIFFLLPTEQLIGMLCIEATLGNHHTSALW